MPKYETMLVTSATLDEEATAAVVGKFKDLIAANGTVELVDEWGKRRLAYPINKENDGVYTLIHFESEPDFPMELDRVYKITDGVLRSLIIAKEPGEELPQPKTVPAPEAEEPKTETPKAEAPKAETAAEEKPKEEAAEEAPAEAVEEAETKEEAAEANEEA